MRHTVEKRERERERERHDATDSKLKFLHKKKQTKIELE